MTFARQQGQNLGEEGEVRPHARGLGPRLPDPVFAGVLAGFDRQTLHVVAFSLLTGFAGIPLFPGRSECPVCPSPALPEVHLCSKHDH